MTKPVKPPSGLAGIHFNVPRFVHYIKPEGFLCDVAACHACFYYAMTARLGYEENELGFGTQYEGDGYENVLWNRSNFRQQWETIGMMYGTAEADMVRHWQCVDMQFLAMGFAGLPDEERYRFNRAAVIFIDPAVPNSDHTATAILLPDKTIILSGDPSHEHRTQIDLSEADTSHRGGCDSDIPRQTDITPAGNHGTPTDGGGESGSGD